MSTCSVRRDSFRGWNACYLENEYVRLVAVPDIGGRIMAYDLGPYSFLWVNADMAGKLFTPGENQGDGSLGAWKNYGGDKTWPAPQGWDTEQQWPGPPDPVLDSGRYSLERLAVEDDRAVIAMTSPPDPRTGVQITRQFTLYPNSSRVRVDLTFTNITDHPIRWGIWDVVQLRAERAHPDGQLTHESACVVTAPPNPDSVFPGGFNVMFGEADNSQWQVDPVTGLFTAPYHWEIGKVGLDSPAGWIALNNAAAGYSFVEQFTYQPGAEYPDGGATVEVWTVGAGQVGNFDFVANPSYQMETEVLGPLTAISPGERTSLSVLWGACRGPGPVIDVSEAGCLAAPLTMDTLVDGYGRVRASGGVFDPGDLHLVWLDGQRNVLAAHSLGPVDPLATITLAQIMKIPARAAHVVLRLTVNGHHRSLAEMALG
jgi:hypothetical protein